MGRDSKKQKQLKKIRGEKHVKQESVRNTFFVSTMSFAFGIIAAGLTYNKAALCFLICSVVIPCKSVFNSRQAEVARVIDKMAKKSMEDARSQMTSNSTISLDGAWNHRRNGTECNVFFIDKKNDLIIHSELVTKTRRNVKGNYTGASGNMETTGVKRGIEELQKYNLPITSYCHDRDNKTKKVFDDNWNELEEKLDTNHVTKGIESRFTKYNIKNCLYGIKNKLIAFYYYLIKNVDSKETRKEQWLNATEHFDGNHQKCLPHKETKFEWKTRDSVLSHKQLNILLSETADLFDKVEKGTTTQSNESCNKLRTYYAAKDTAFQASFPCRVNASILQKNRPYEWIPEAMNNLNIPPPSGEAGRRLNQYIEENKNRRSFQKTPEYNDKRKISREKNRKIKSKENSVKIDYKTEVKSKPSIEAKSPLLDYSVMRKKTK